MAGVCGLCGVAVRRGVQRALEARVQQRARASQAEQRYQRVQLPLERLVKEGGPPSCAEDVLRMCWAVLGPCWGRARAVRGAARVVW